MEDFFCKKSGNISGNDLFECLWSKTNPFVFVRNIFDTKFVCIQMLVPVSENEPRLYKMRSFQVESHFSYEF